MRWLAVSAVAMLCGVVAPAFASGGHGGEVASVVLALAVILVGAKLGGDLATRVGQPAVLGELLMGVVFGNVVLAGFHGFEPIKDSASIAMLAELGVIILLFEVGLESTVRDMMKVGLPSLLVAALGVIMPFFLGWFVGALLLPDHSVYVHLFLGATLTATSVGITARVLQDLGRSKSPEARVILGAAVIDDVMGLIILAVVGGLITAANQETVMSYTGIGLIVGKAIVFLFGSLAIGVWLSPRLFSLASRLRGRGVLLASGLAFCFFLAWLAAVVGLAPIVGAYAAGLILEDVHFRNFPERKDHGLEELVHPVSAILSPVFFVLMGMRVELAAFSRGEVLGLAALLTVAAVIGKQVCSLGVWRMPRLNRLAIGIGMIPRGEVGLIFANIGLGLAVAGERIVDEHIYSAVVIMVIVTTLVTPPALRWAFARNNRA